MKLVAAATALALTTLATASVFAQTADGFGQKGVFAISAQGGTDLLGQESHIGLTPLVGLEFRNYDSPEVPGGGYERRSHTWFYLNPGLDYFVIDRLSIGGEILFASHSTSTRHHGAGIGGSVDETETYVGLLPRIGYDFPLGRSFSIWPRGGIGIQSVSRGSGGNDESWWYLQADVPFLFHPVAHFFIGAGPGITLTLSHTNSVAGSKTDGVTNFRLLSAVLGGWF